MKSLKNRVIAGDNFEPAIKIEQSILYQSHCLKTINPFFSKVWDGVKLFEHRKNDRNFQVNDIVFLQEFYPENEFFSGAEITARITFVLKDFKGLDPDYCIFSLEILNREIYKASLAGLINKNTSNITLQECMKIIEDLSKKKHSFIDEVPEILKVDFNNFITGKTLYRIDNRVCTYDMKEYYKKLMNKGTDYSIQWKL